MALSPSGTLRLMSILRDFISDHRPLLQRREAELMEQLASVRRELRELDRAEAAITDKEPAPKVAVPEPDENMPTIKEMVVEVLGLLPEGAEALKILRLINERFGTNLQRESLSPQLSRLKKAETIRLEGRTWFLNEEGSAEAEPSIYSTGPEAGARGAASHHPPEGSIPSGSTPVKGGSLATPADLHVTNQGGRLM